MAQSATKERALLGIEPFWEKPTLEPPLRWDRWQIMLKLAIMAKEGIMTLSLTTLRTRSPYPQNLFTRMMSKIAQLKVNEIDVPETNRSKIRGLIDVKKSNMLAYCVEKILGSTVITKQSL